MRTDKGKIEHENFDQCLILCEIDIKFVRVQFPYLEKKFLILDRVSKIRNLSHFSKIIRVYLTVTTNTM